MWFLFAVATLGLVLAGDSVQRGANFESWWALSLLMPYQCTQVIEIRLLRRWWISCPQRQAVPGSEQPGLAIGVSLHHRELEGTSCPNQMIYEMLCTHTALCSYMPSLSRHPSFFSVSLACLKPTVFNCVCGCTIFLVPAIVLSLQGSSEAVASVHQQHMHSSWAGLSVRELMRWFLAGSLWDVAGCSRNLRVAELSAACSAEFHLPCRTTLSWLGEYGKGMGSCWGGLC